MLAALALAACQRAAYPSFAAAQDAVAVAGSGAILSCEQAKRQLQRSAAP